MCIYLFVNKLCWCQLAIISFSDMDTKVPPFPPEKNIVELRGFLGIFRAHRPRTLPPCLVA